MAHHPEPFDGAMRTAHTWLVEVAERLGTDDRPFAYRAIRAWLHTVRDRITVAGAAHLSAQLPVVLRGVFFEGWVPTQVPVGHGTKKFAEDFAHEAGISIAEAPVIAGAVTRAFADLFSAGQLDAVFAVLPADLANALSGDTRSVEFEDEDAIEVPADNESARLADLESW